MEVIMLEFKSKALTIIVNFFLLLWQLPQLILPGLICLAIFHNCKLYRNEEAKITVLRVSKGNLLGTACFSSGPIIFVTDNCDENTLHHETGHSAQSLIFGPLFHLVVSLPSVIRFWYRRIKKLPSSWYYKAWPESSAERLGHTHRD
jgi:hypothetical protein